MKIFGIEIKFDSNADQTAKEFKKVADGVKDVDDKIKDVDKSSKASSGGLKKVGTSLKAIGKGVGIIALISAAFDLLKETIGKNQKVIDFFSTTFEALSIAFNDFFNFIFDNVGGVVDSFKAFFEDPLESLKNLGTAIQNNIIERFTSAIEAIGFLGDAIVKVFKGDFSGAAESAKNAGKEFIDTLTGVDDSFDKTVETVGKAIDATGKYVKETVKAAKTNVDLASSAAIAEARQQGLVEKYDRQAEQLRQVRDEERNTIDERIEANNKLKETLDEQEEAMLAQVNAQIASAAAQVAKNANEENQIALIQAQNEKLAVQATIVGFRAEQKSNDLALDKEQKEMTNSLIESETNLGIERKRIAAEEIENNLERLEEQKKIDAEEKRIQTERLQKILDQTREGTQARIDAQIALNDFTAEAERQEVERAKEIAAEKLAIKTKGEEDAQKIRAQEVQAEKDAADAKQAIQDAVFGAADAGVALVKQLAGENRAAQAAALIAENAIGIAKIIISTRAANAAAKLTPQAVLTSGAAAIPVIAANNISAGIGIASSIAATAKGLSALKAGGSAGGAGGNLSGGESSSGGGGGQAPSFNVVGDSTFNQLAELQQQPTQAFVVSGEVTTAQALDRNRIQNATL